MGRLGTDPVTDLVTRPGVPECDVGQPGSRAAGPDRVGTNAPPDRRGGTGLCIQIPVCAVVGVLLMTESPADVVSLLLGLGWLVVFAGVPRLSGGPKFVCCRFRRSRAGWSGRERACSRCGTGPRRRSAPWSQRSHRHDLDRLAMAWRGCGPRATATPVQFPARLPMHSKLRRRCPTSSSARWRPS